MSMGIVQPGELENELARLNENGNGLAQEARIKELNKGRGNGNTQVPESLRKIIGEESIQTPASEIAKAFQVSPSSISAYANGANSTASYHNPSPELKNHVASAKQKVVKRATKKLFRALDCINEDKLEEIGKEKPQVVSAVARDLAQIVRAMDEGDEDNDRNITQNVIFYAPAMRDIKDFGEVIDVE